MRKIVIKVGNRYLPIKDFYGVLYDIDENTFEIPSVGEFMSFEGGISNQMLRLYKVEFVHRLNQLTTITTPHIQTVITIGLKKVNKSFKSL